MILSTDWQLRQGVSLYLLLFASFYTDYEASAPECLVVPKIIEWAIVLTCYHIHHFCLFRDLQRFVRSCVGEI
jgi:hypothetical protein